MPRVSARPVPAERVRKTSQPALDLSSTCATHNREMPRRSAVKRPFTLDKVITSAVEVRKCVAIRRNVFSTRKSTRYGRLMSAANVGYSLATGPTFYHTRKFTAEQCLTSAMIMGKVFSSNSSLKITREFTQVQSLLRMLNVGNPLRENHTLFSTRKFTLEQNLTSAMPVGELSATKTDLLSIRVHSGEKVSMRGSCERTFIHKDTLAERQKMPH